MKHLLIWWTKVGLSITAAKIMRPLGLASEEQQSTHGSSQQLRRCPTVTRRWLCDADISARWSTLSHPRLLLTIHQIQFDVSASPSLLEKPIKKKKKKKKESTDCFSIAVWHESASASYYQNVRNWRIYYCKVHYSYSAFYSVQKR